jgi:hypothetical protein
MNTYNTREKCALCGADYGLHRSDDDRCPAGGVEETRPDHTQQWSTLTFQPFPSPSENMQHLANMMEFIDAVGKMRHAQKSFFKLRKSGTQKEIGEWLAESKRLEKEIDQYLAKFNERNSPQKKLF